LTDNYSPTDEQRLIIRHRHAPAIVVAGAGSGKTHTVVSHVMDLIVEGTDPQDIMMLTFTRKAAEEMRERLAATIGHEKADKVRAGTFHGIGSHELRRHGWQPDPTGNPQNIVRDFDVLGQGEAEDSLDLVRLRLNQEYSKELLKEMDLPSTAKIHEFISLCKNKQLSTRDGLKRLPLARKWKHPQIEPYLETLQARWRNEKLKNRELTYDDVLDAWLDLILRRPGTVANIQAIIVDESQDMNKNQFDIAYALFDAASTSHLMMVGDAAQSIYGWRGADVHQFDKFDDIINGGVRYTLSENFRSTPQILEVANHVLEGCNIKSIAKLRTRNADGPKPVLKGLDTPNEQARYVLDEMAKLPDDETVATIARTSMSLRPIEMQLRKANTPYAVFGGTPFSELNPVRDIMAMLRFAYTTMSEASMLRLLRLFDNIGSQTANEIISVGVPDCLTNNPFASRSGVRAQTAKYATDVLLSVWHRMTHTTWPDTMAHATTIYRWIRVEQKKASIKRRQENLSPEAIRAEIDTFKSETLDPLDHEIIPSLLEFAKMAKSATEFVDMFKLDRPQPSSDEDARISLTTVHSAKGLEYDNVFVVNCTDYDFSEHGSARTPEDAQEEQEEQRRCLYVAVTRAKKRLWCIWPKYDPIKREKCMPSRYLPTDTVAGKKTRHRAPAKAKQDDSLDWYYRM
jgi:DNA helicase-2/ATP-dependent DNA helicase PcrA